MRRRNVLCAAGLAPLCSLLPRVSRAAQAPAPWHWYELRYEIDVSAQPGPGRVWVPVPQECTAWQHVLAIECDCDRGDVHLERQAVYGAPIVVGEFRNGGRLGVSALVAVRERGPGAAVDRSDAEAAALYLRPTAHMPVDGVVAECAASIVTGIAQPADRARAIYDWIVDNTFRDPKVHGCGTGDIRAMLTTGNLGGKCADINALFVGLARAAGLPARDVYGIRAGPSRQFNCLGCENDNLAHAQHCRAEFFDPVRGWVPVDPADVRKVVLEEKLTLEDTRVQALRERLFGWWEMNWLAFNSARDFQPFTRARAPLPFLMHPHAEFGERVLDGRDAAAFSYRISSTEQSA